MKITRYKPNAMMVQGVNRFIAVPIMSKDKRGEYVLYSDVKNLEELERLAQIGADLEYVSNIKWIGNIPSVAHVQELAKIWREKEGETNEDMV